MKVGGRRIAVDVAITAQPSVRRKSAPKARLREDRVALGVLHDLKSALRTQVPDGKTIILTLGAPIKVSTQLVAALTRILPAYLDSGAVDIEEKRPSSAIGFASASSTWTRP